MSTIREIVLCTKIETKIGKSLPVEWIFKYPIISSLSEAIEEFIDAIKNVNSVITAFQIEGTQPPFFWLHGGKAVPLILEQLGTDQPFYFLRHQSIEGHRAEHLSIPEIAGYYLLMIQEIDPEGPYYFGGYSIGGMIIYEIARQLVEQGKNVALLFITEEIEKAVIIYINNREIEDRITLFNGKIEACAINCNHLQLIETSHSFIWIKIIKRSISVEKYPPNSVE